LRIIIEGADLTGKSTIAKKIAKQFNLSYVHVIRKDIHTIPFYYNLLDKHDIVFDRHFIGEMIYPYLFHRDPEFGQQGFKIILDKADKLGYKIIIAYLTDEQLMSRLKSRGEECQDTIDTLLKANHWFIDIARINNMPLINTEEMSYEEILNIIGVD